MDPWSLLTFPGGGDDPGEPHSTRYCPRLTTLRTVLDIWHANAGLERRGERGNADVVVGCELQGRLAMTRCADLSQIVSGLLTVSPRTALYSQETLFKILSGLKTNCGRYRRWKKTPRVLAVQESNSKPCPFSLKSGTRLRLPLGC
jgi:hypothetical protein